MPATFYTSAQWRERARRTWATIDQLVDPMARRTLASIATAYEKLAVEAEGRDELSRTKPVAGERAN